MKQTLLLLAMVFSCQLAFSQSNSYARVKKESTVVKYDQAHAIINGVKTSNNIMGLFKPNEINLTRVHSEHVSMHVLVFGIEVKDNAHPVLKYFEHNARLYHNGRFYKHNVIPDINPAQVQSLVFHAATDSSESYLEVKLHDKDQVPTQKYRYGTAGERTKYYDVNGEVMETTSIAHLGLRKGTYTSEVLCCKEAYEKYNDLRFIEGIQVIRSK